MKNPENEMRREALATVALANSEGGSVIERTPAPESVPARPTRVLGDAATGHLSAMLAADEKLYERILDTPNFAYHFNELVKLAKRAEVNNG